MSALKRSFLDSLSTSAVATCLALAGAMAALVPLAVPHAASAVGCDDESAILTVSPLTAVNPANTSHTVTATLTHGPPDEVTGGCLTPFPGEVIGFRVTGTVTQSGQCTTEADGRCSFTYDGPGVVGADTITAFHDENGNGAWNNNIEAPCDSCAGAIETTVFVVTNAWGPAVASDRDDCLNGGWQTAVDEDGGGFSNQGDCMRYVKTGK